MESLTVAINHQIKLNPKQLAELFCSMSANEQVCFLNWCTELISKWKEPVDFQLTAIMEHEQLQFEAQDLLKKISEFIK